MSIVSPDYSGIRLQQVLGRIRRIGGGKARQIICFPDTIVGRRMSDLVRSKLDALADLTEADFASCL